MSRGADHNTLASLSSYLTKGMTKGAAPRVFAQEVREFIFVCVGPSKRGKSQYKGCISKVRIPRKIAPKRRKRGGFHTADITVTQKKLRDARALRLFSKIIINKIYCHIRINKYWVVQCEM